MKKRKDRVFLVLAIIGWIFIAYLIIGGIVKRQSMDNNLEYSNAIVIDYFYTIRYTDFFSYSFFVGEKEFRGSGKYYPLIDTLSVGDSIIVVYDRKNPNNNSTYRDYKNGLLK